VTENDEWAKHVLDEVVPKIEGSTVTISLVPTGETDVKFAVELGLSIMLDKPILAVVQPGTKIPGHLARVADRIVEFRDDDPEGTQRGIRDALSELYDDKE
jgi:hypothetical protein